MLRGEKKPAGGGPKRTDNAPPATHASYARAPADRQSPTAAQLHAWEAENGITTPATSDFGAMRFV